MKNPVTENLLKELDRTVSYSSNERTFLSEYYHRLSGQDYAPERAQHLFDAFRFHMDLAQKREPGENLIQVDLCVDNVESQSSLVSIVTNDRPFIIDSLTITLEKFNKRIERINHPIFDVTRSKRHKLTTLTRRKADRLDNTTTSTEAFIQFEVDPVSSDEKQTLIAELQKVLRHIEFVTNDWQDMREAALSLGHKVEKKNQGPAFAEYQPLLQWLADDHFAFIGYGEIEQTISASGTKDKIDDASLRGILRVFSEEDEDILSILPPLIESKTSPLIFTRSRQRIRIHRANYLDVILIDHNHGQASRGKTRKRKISVIVGFLAGSTLTSAISAIPHLRSKATYVLEQSTLRKKSYAYKELRALIETLPREIVFQFGSGALYRLCMTLLNHHNRRKTRVHLKRNVCGHFYSCLVYIPKDLFNTGLRKRIQAHLAQRLNASEVTFNVYFPESILTRIHFTAFTPNAVKRSIKPEVLEREISNMAQDWVDHLHQELRNQLPLKQANGIFDEWQNGFTQIYKLDHDTTTAVQDINILDQHRVIELGGKETPGLISTRVECDDDGNVSHLRLYSTDQSMPLSDALPILDNMGLRVPGEQPYSICHRDGQTFWINHFHIVDCNGDPLAGHLKSVIEEGFAAVWFNQCDNDGFNQLIVANGFNWRQTSVIRCYFRYLKQIRLRYSAGHIIESLLKNPQLTETAVSYFEAQFDPDIKKKSVEQHLQTVARLLPEIKTLDEERIFVALIDTIKATARTNYFQRDDGQPKDTLSLKLRPRMIPRIPEPAPKHEIYVYSPRMEGVHLRGGDVARGGLRWSERPDDFRTEVLGLVKAQQVKNAVIVPVGSKGGFIAKQLPDGDRDKVQKEVIACYQLFISGLLDITDNIIGKKVIPAPDCVRLDGDDPYLVVAADKGTATFSDIANAISLNGDFWLGDAFASGGSDGYDHKKMGITARGAWESVKRHFREIGKDIQNQDFTVAAVGDMAGDVFGNGMLLSRHIQLVAAFNHMHIFIDPAPDASRSYAERKRLFALPRSSWTDYNSSLISKGGGIYSRAEKSITLSPQAMKALSTSRSQFTPDELINTILKSEVELIWNGGIGTYIKATDETHEDAQDRGNDSLRVNASEVRARVVGEGGNLGVTQNARIEFNRLGGYCYTDAIDNSAGVDTSDHEVNIKILLNQLVSKNKLSVKERNKFLGKMENAVADHVLSNNYIQTEILSIEATFARERMNDHILSMQTLTNSGALNRQIEHLPDDAQLALRQSQGDPLTRAELAVVLAYSKMDLYDALLESDIPQEKRMEPVLLSYFPELMNEEFGTELKKHPLSREIISTVITNDVIGTAGLSFHFRFAQTTDTPVPQVIRAYLFAKEVIQCEELTSVIRQLDNKVPALLQQKLLAEVGAAIESCVAWLIANHKQEWDGNKIRKRYARGLKDFNSAIAELDQKNSPQAFREICDELAQNKVKKATLAALENIWVRAFTLDIIDISMQSKRSVEKVLKCYFAVQTELKTDFVRAAMLNLPAEDHWRQQAKSTLLSNLRTAHIGIVTDILGNDSKLTVDKAMKNWRLRVQKDLEHIDSMRSTLDQDTEPDFALLSVLSNALAQLNTH